MGVGPRALAERVCMGWMGERHTCLHVAGCVLCVIHALRGEVQVRWDFDWVSTWSPGSPTHHLWVSTVEPGFSNSPFVGLDVEPGFSNTPFVGLDVEPGFSSTPVVCLKITTIH